MRSGGHPLKPSPEGNTLWAPWCAGDYRRAREACKSRVCALSAWVFLPLGEGEEKKGSGGHPLKPPPEGLGPSGHHGEEKGVSAPLALREPSRPGPLSLREKGKQKEDVQEDARSTP